MRYTLEELLRPELILLSLNAISAEDILQQMSKTLIRLGYATLGFFEDVWQREQKYPTGLPTQPFAVALPHADSDHITKTALCFATTASPVKFGQMGSDGSKRLDVYLIILLAIREREKQVELISQLVQLLQTPGLLERLYKTQTPDEFIKLIKEYLP
jgi:PTS system galactitol-specific IIA component